MILKIFSPKKSAKKIGVFDSKRCHVFQKLARSIVFFKAKHQFSFRLKALRIVIITLTPWPLVFITTLQRKSDLSMLAKLCRVSA
jgi:hypothetical protein